MTNHPILITGAAGFIGSHLSHLLLSQGRRVVGFDNFCDFYDPALKECNIQGLDPENRFVMIRGDIRDRQAIMDAFAQYQPQCVVHIAAMAGVRPSIEQPDYYTKVNIDGTINVLDAAVAHGRPRVVFASSSSVYGNNPKVPFSEDDPVDHPISPYAATKKAGELICHTYSHLYDITMVCLRFFTVYGPRQRPDLAISKFLRLVSEGKPLTMFGDGSTSRDYTFINDILAGINSAIQVDPEVLVNRCISKAPFGVYNLGGNEPVSLKELIRTIEDVTGCTAKIDQQPMQPGDVTRTYADLTHSQKDLGYQPTTCLRDGIHLQWQSMQPVNI